MMVAIHSPIQVRIVMVTIYSPVKGRGWVGYNSFTCTSTGLGWLQFMHSRYEYGVVMVTIHSPIQVRVGYDPFTGTSTGWDGYNPFTDTSTGWLQSIHLYKHGVRSVTIYSHVQVRGWVGYNLCTGTSTKL